LPRWKALSAEWISQIIWRDIGTSSVFQLSHSFVQQDSVLRQDTWSMRQEMPEKAPPKTFEKEKEYHQE
jgi:hypothetical protein